MKQRSLYLIVLLVTSCLSFSQKETEPLLLAPDTVKVANIDPLRPSKAAFFSAILPGLGQAYNKKYWKIPIVYAGLATGIYFYANNNNNYLRFRDAYKRRLAGFEDDEFQGIYSDQTLINAQRQFQRNRDISLLVTLGIYILNIIDANVDAHLLQFNVNDKLTVRPDIYQNDQTLRQNVGLTINYRF